eukprot:3665263-Pyramimonas_sp.AAC.1
MYIVIPPSWAKIPLPPLRTWAKIPSYSGERSFHLPYSTTPFRSIVFYLLLPAIPMDKVTEGVMNYHPLPASLGVDLGLPAHLAAPGAWERGTSKVYEAIPSSRSTKLSTSCAYAK